MTVEEIDELQKAAMDEFIEHVKYVMKNDRTFLSNPPKSSFEWLGLMQHYRVPTSLLDWSFSPYIAAYFAVASSEHWRTDGAVWFFDESFVEAYLNINMYAAAGINKTKLDPALMQYSSIKSTHPNPRIEAQRGLFTWHRDINKDQDVFIDDCLSHIVTYKHDEHGNPTKEVVSLHTLQEHYGKIIIPAALKPEILKELSIKKIISAMTVYTGLDGLGQSIAEFIQLRVAKQPKPCSPQTIMMVDWLTPTPSTINPNDPPSPPSEPG